MPLDDGVLVVVERARLLQHRVGHRELADVVDERRRSRACAGARGRARAPRRPEPRAARHAGCAARCRRPCSASRTVSARTWEPRNTSSAATSSAPPGRPRAAGTARCARGRARRDPDDQDPVELEHVPEPPAELREGQGQRATSARREPHEPDHDEQVGDAPGEQEGADARRREDRRQRDRRPGARSRRAVRRRHRRQEARPEERRRSRARSRGESAACEGEQRLHAAQDARQRDAESARITAPAGSVAPPVIATTPFSRTRAGRREPVQRQQAAMTANAVPTSTVRVSERRAPITVKPNAAPAATSALKPTE